ncbi:hypothetical protein ACN28E_45235 [Archangium lansingense]|uniref:hypothetical protein n=1 Tax=Archangium lansingense TaxID=2995310 RepID=UPI003B76AC32
MDWLLSTSTRPDVYPRAVLYVLVLGTLVCAAAAVRMLLHWSCWSLSFRRACHQLRKGGGWLPRAEEHFQAAARCSRGPRRTAALAGVGFCRMNLGGYAEAAAVLEPLMEQQLPRSMWMDALILPAHLSLCLAMLGKTSRARRWLGEAHARFGAKVSFLVLPEVAILCREGHLGAALKLMEASWPVVMADRLVCTRLRLFRAYAQWKVDPERDREFIYMTLLSLALLPERELAFCREHWPVLADFIQMGQELVARHDQQRALRQAELEARHAERGAQSKAGVTLKPEDGEDTAH